MKLTQIEIRRHISLNQPKNRFNPCGESDQLIVHFSYA